MMQFWYFISQVPNLDFLDLIYAYIVSYLCMLLNSNPPPRINNRSYGNSNVLRVMLLSTENFQLNEIPFPSTKNQNFPSPKLFQEIKSLRLVSPRNNLPFTKSKLSEKQIHRERKPQRLPPPSPDGKNIAEVSWRPLPSSTSKDQKYSESNTLPMSWSNPGTNLGQT